MTKVQLEYDLQRPLDESLMAQIARLHGVYGILRVSVKPSLREITVEYDATRLTPSEVEAVLEKSGLPVMKRA
jgi:copper chaperone CopZ